MMTAVNQARVRADGICAVLPNNIPDAPAAFVCDVFRPIIMIGLPAPGYSLDPETGDHWRADRPQYWDIAAVAWDNTAVFSERGAIEREREAAYCRARATELRRTAA